MAARELEDYSGEFDPRLRYTDFSKEAMARLMSAWWKIALQADVWWHRVVREKIGADAARECNPLVWVRIAKQEIKWMREALNVRGDDVASFFKVMQNDIGFPVELFDLTWDLKSPNHGIITVNRCGGLEFYKRESERVGSDMTHWLCHEYEPQAFNAYSHAFNPNIKVVALKLPPQAPGEPACQWEFRLGR